MHEIDHRIVFFCHTPHPLVHSQGRWLGATSSSDGVAPAVYQMLSTKYFRSKRLKGKKGPLPLARRRRMRPRHSAYLRIILRWYTTEDETIIQRLHAHTCELKRDTGRSSRVQRLLVYAPLRHGFNRCDVVKKVEDAWMHG